MPPAAQELRAEPFSSVRLIVEERLKLVLRRPKEVLTYDSAVVGYVRDRFMIVLQPMQQGVSVPISEDERVEVRLFSGTHVYSFNTKVQRVFRAPIFYLHLDFPDKVFSTPLRNAMRVDVDLATDVRVADWSVAARLTNLSATGAAFAVADELAVREGDAATLAFSIALPDAASLAVSAASTIQSIKPNPKKSAPGWLYGVKFAELQRTELLAINNLVYEKRFG